MTVEECKERLEGKRGGDLKYDGVEDVGGAFMIINGLLDKDHDFEEGKEEVDRASFGETNNKVDNDDGEVAVVKETKEKNGDGGSLRGNGEDLVSGGIAGEKDVAMESSRGGAAIEKEEALKKSADSVDDDLERDQGGETLDVEAQVLSEESSVEEVAGADTDIRRESGVAVGETKNRSESDVDVAETDSLVESKVVVTEDILESEVDVTDTDNHQEESEVAVADTDSRSEAEITVPDAESRLESDVIVVENDRRQKSEVDVAEANRQEEKELPVEVEDKEESETEVGEPVGNSEQKQEHTTGDLVSEECIIEETDDSEVRGLEPEPQLSIFDNDNQKESQSQVEVEVEVNDNPQSELDQTNENSVAESRELVIQGESDSDDYDATIPEKDENLEVVDSLEVDESNGCTNEIETVTVFEKEPEEIKTMIAPAKETEEYTTDATTQAAVETAVMKRRHIFMVKVPKLANDEQLKRKIQQALSRLEEKTRFCDSVQEEIRKSMVIIDQNNKEIAAASSKENAARLKYNAKRKELEGVQVLLNRINCAVSISDIDEKIRKMVHMQQHETIALRQEKQYINEINQLKRLREQLSLKNSSQEQTDNALSQISEIERQFENLKKELTPINDSWKSAKDRKQAAWKRCNDEKDLLRNLIALHQVANGIRQEVYMQLLELRKQATDKFKHFGMYKADQNAVATYRFSGDNVGLRSHCDRQVEMIMELWNYNDDFRKEYVKSNVHSTLLRLGTLDGRSLGLDEEPPAIIISHLDKRPNNLSVLVSRIDTPAASELKQEFPETQKLASTNHSSRTKSSKNLIPQEVMSTICDHQEPQKEDEKESKVEEVAELARKEEQPRKNMEEAAAELKERIILEQKVKAKEAEERKKWKEEKNKTKAEQRVQKEADLREQKKARKEMKRASFTKTTGDRDGQTVSMTDIPSTSSGGAETTSLTLKRSTRVTGTAKQERVHTLPLPLRNKGRRKMTTWLWVALIAISVLLIFLAGNYLSF